MIGGFDNMVKVYDVEDWKVVYIMCYFVFVLFFVVFFDDIYIVVGMIDGIFFVCWWDFKVFEFGVFLV